jgi:hypothetical protein
MIGRIIAFVLGNFTLTFLVVALLCSAIAIARAPKPIGRASAFEKLLSWFVFWTIGVLYFYNAVFHIFFGQLAAHYIGWEDSPFQLEVGTASLGVRRRRFPRCVRKLRPPPRGHHRPRHLHARRSGRPRLPDDHGPQFCARQCRHHFLERYLASVDWLCRVVAAAA